MRTPLHKSAPQRAAAAPARRGSPWRRLLPMALGLALLAWMLELGRDRPRARVEEQAGPLLEIPGAAPP